ncbi:MAG: hypothetical protein ACJAVS_000200 [Paracoccaceae bacterium]
MTQIDAPAAAAKQTPLFYATPEVLEAARHATLGLLPHTGFAFAAAANAIPLNMAEFAQAGVWYPIVFTGKETVSPVAVVGVRKSQNLFVDASGAWTPGAYVPAYARRHPFILTRPDAAKDQVLLCVDRSSDRLVDAGGDGFFADGKPTVTTTNAMDFCLNFQRQAMATEQVSAVLAEHDLLSDQTGTLELPGGETVRLTDFKIIDEKKLNALSDEALLDLRRRGALAMAYCQMMSMNNWGRLTTLAAARKV